MKRNPKDMERQIRTVAGEQAGYFTAAQAKAIGYEYPQQHFHRTRGNWDQVERGIFCVFRSIVNTRFGPS